jgi:hypothetical protein
MQRAQSETRTRNEPFLDTVGREQLVEHRARRYAARRARRMDAARARPISC